MPSGLTSLAGARFVSSDDQFSQTAALSVPSTNNIILSFRTPPGLRGLLTDFRQAWDGGLDTYLSYYLRINGGILYPLTIAGGKINSYVGSKVQIAAPETDTALPVPIIIEQLSLVEVVCDVATGATSGTATARVICKYYDPNSGTP